MANDYESLSLIELNSKRYLPEVYQGGKIVQWYGTIERQIAKFLSDANSARNFDYADKLRKFLDIWRDNEITGSINRETLESLKVGAELLAVDNWNLASYFSPLRDQLRVLIASEEELPRGIDQDQNMEFGGPSGRGLPPMSPSFGPEKDMPPGAEPPGGEPVPGEGEPPGAGEPMPGEEDEKMPPTGP